MEIEIKTAEEFRDAHVTIKVTGMRLGDRLYTAAEVGAAQASEAELVSAPLRRRIEELETELARVNKGHVCVETCRPNAHVAFRGRREMDALEEEVSQGRRQILVLGDELITERERNARLELGNAELARTVTRLREELAAERQRAIDNRNWAERAEGRLASAGLKLADAERAIEVLSAQLGKVSGVVHGSAIQAALRTQYSSLNAKSIRDALCDVREALGSPRLPTSPGWATSQA